MYCITVFVIFSMLFAVGIFIEIIRRKRRETDINLWLLDHNNNLKAIKKQLKKGV